MGVSPDGTKVFVTGAGPGGYNTVALDASTGTVLWVARYSGPVGGPDFPTALAVSPVGTRVFVTGVSRGFLSICGVNQAGQVGMGPLDTHPCFDFATVAYEASGGEMLWVTRSKARTGGGDDGATALSVSPDGSKVFVTGTSSPPPEDVSDYATYAYAASTGATLWMRVYADPADSPAFPAAIQASPDGTKVFVTGTSGDSFGTIAYDARRRGWGVEWK